MHHNFSEERKMQSAVLILGARGRFGLAAARAFADAGWKVFAQMRPGAQIPATAKGDSRIEWLAMDLHDTASLARTASGAAVVVHALNPAYTQKAWKTLLLPLADAATEVARSLHATLMVPGNVYNFGSEMPSVLG